MKSPASKKLPNLALIGAGYWGKNLARNFSNLGVLHTICDVSKKAALELSAEYAGVKALTNTEELFKNDDITAVAIAAPAVLHYSLVKRAIEYGKDVFVEKPLCLDLGEAKELLNLALQKQRVLMVGHLLQYHPCIEKIQYLINSEEIGKLLYISSHRLNLGKIRKEENSLWSFAPHDLSVILSLCNNNMPLQVECMGGAYLTEGVYDTTMTTLLFEGNIRAHVYVSWLNPFKEQKMTVIGSKGMLVFDDTRAWGEKLTIYKDYIAWNNGNPVPKKSAGSIIEVNEDEPLKLECAHFLQCCTDRSQPKTDANEGYRVLSVLQTAQKCLERKNKF